MSQNTCGKRQIVLNAALHLSIFRRLARLADVARSSVPRWQTWSQISLLQPFNSIHLLIVWWAPKLTAVVFNKSGLSTVWAAQAHLHRVQARTRTQTAFSVLHEAAEGWAPSVQSRDHRCSSGDGRNMFWACAVPRSECR